MPFGESQSRVYVTIVEGMLAVRSSEADPKAVKRDLKTGHTIYERRYKSFTGRLKEISFRKQDYNGKQWEELVLSLFDGSDYYQVQIPFPSNYSNSFLRALPNVDLSKDITINPWRKETPEKIRTALYINQDGRKESVQWAYTQDNPNGLPDLVPYTIPGSSDVKYSDVDRNIFFRKLVSDVIASKLAGPGGNAMPAESRMASNNIPEASSITEPIDDLPF